MADALQPELDQECLRGAISHRTARRTLAATNLDPADLHERVDGSLGQGDATDVLDLGARDRLVVGNDGQSLERGARQALLLRLFLAQEECGVRRGPELPFLTDAE